MRMPKLLLYIYGCSKTLNAVNLKADVSRCQYVLDSQNKGFIRRKKINIIIIWMQPTGKVDIAGQSGKLH